MDVGTQLVQAYLRLNGYLTVAEYPLVEERRHDAIRTLTDIDLLAVRDLASWLRHGPDAPTAEALDHVIGTGQSQCGRFLRTFSHLGLNLDEQDRPVFDGLLVHIAGGRRGEFNHRWAQPSVQPTPGFGHLPPHADEPHPSIEAGTRGAPPPPRVPANTTGEGRAYRGGACI